MELKTVPIVLIIAGVVVISLGVQIYLAKEEIVLLSLFGALGLGIIFLGAFLWFWRESQTIEVSSWKS